MKYVIIIIAILISSCDTADKEAHDAYIAAQAMFESNRQDCYSMLRYMMPNERSQFIDFCDAHGHRFNLQYVLQKYQSGQPLTKEDLFYY